MKHLVQSSVALTSIAPFAQADISYFTVDIAPIGNSGALYFDFSENTQASEEFTGADIAIAFAFQGSEKPLLSIVNSNYSIAVNDTNYARRYDFGQELAFTSTNSTEGYLEISETGQWVGDVGGETGYAALINTTDSKEVWIEIDYDDSNNTVDILSYAIGDSADNMTAGEVPEPAETAALMILAAGSAALYSRRKRK